jgi:hypothetical protein
MKADAKKMCETCAFLNEEPTPCECKKGKGQVAYRHPACEKYKEKKRERKD